MTRTWTFGQKVGGGFAVTVLLTILVAVLAMSSLKSAVASKDRVINGNAARQFTAQTMALAAARKVNAARGYTIAPHDTLLTLVRTERTNFQAAARELRGLIEDPEERQLLDAIERSEVAHQEALERVIALRQTNAPLEALAKAFAEDAQPKQTELARSIDLFLERGERTLLAAQQSSTDAANTASGTILVIAIAAVLLATLIALFLTTSLARQIGSAVHNVQNSSAELQAAANQQATGTKEQATAMNEITTTVTELLATSRQIAESAKRVAQIAEQTANGARAGDVTVNRATESIDSIKRQVDLIVSHMLDLGRKSQQIGGILEIINELAEQTNILSINATIEAAGAGESGRRFAVVGDEVRKLAERVSSSTKEIRGLVDEIRGAVNTTVMATEGGSKAVDAGARQFGDVADSFKAINGLVVTTTQAAKEIELSTRQQSTAVEQVKLAIGNVFQATREAEASCTQTLQTATQLSSLSRDLNRLIQNQSSM